MLCGALVLAALPWAVSRIPAGGSDVGASDLLARIQQSSNVAYSGYAESVGTLALPATDQFNAITDLLGARTQMRVWWSGPTRWRVDTVTLTGETDLHRVDGALWTWQYEDNRATLTDGELTPDVRLPRSDDLTPPNLALRLLGDATADEVQRLPSARVAGHDAAGLRVHPKEPQSTIDHLDVWALGSGLPVRVAAYPKGSPTAVLSTSFLDLSTGAPSESDIAFTPPAAARVRQSRGTDILSFINQLGRSRPPDSLAGLPRSSASPGVGAVGVYGRDVTLLLAVPLPSRVAGPLLDQLEKAAGSVQTDAGVALGIPGLNLLLGPSDRDGSAWLVAGTVTPQTLTQAVSELPGIDGFSR